MAEDLEERARERAREAERARSAMQHARDTVSAGNRRGFVLATSKWGFFGQGTFCYLFGLLGLMFVGFLFLMHLWWSALPDLTELPIAVAFVLGASPIALAIVIYIAVPARLRANADRVLAEAEVVPVANLADEIGGASDGSRQEMKFLLRFAGSVPAEGELLAMVQRVHPDARVEMKRDREVLVHVPRGSNRRARIFASDSGRIPDWFVARICLQLWRDMLEAVLVPLHATHPLADIRLDV